MWWLVCAYRGCNHFDNYVLEFPVGSTPDERALLLLSVFQLDFQEFEATGDENDDSASCFE
jgi:hypothetical protein